MQIEYLRQRSIETISPQVRTRRGIDELAGNAQALARPAYTALDHVADTQLAPDLPHVHGPTLVSEARIPRDDEQVAKVRQGSDDVLHYAVGKIVLLGIAAQVLKWHHRNRWPVVRFGRDCEDLRLRCDVGGRRSLLICGAFPGLQRSHQGVRLCLGLRIQMLFQGSPTKLELAKRRVLVAAMSVNPDQRPMGGLGGGV